MTNHLINRVCPSLEELTPDKGKRHSTKNSTLESSVPVETHYHCPVEGCVYANNSVRYFSQLMYLRQHVRKVHLPKLHSCEKCKKGFAALSDLKRHSLVCGTVFNCSTCEMQYSSREALLTHAKRKLHAIHEAPSQKNRRFLAESSNVIPNNVESNNGESKFKSCVFVLTSNIMPAAENNSTKAKGQRLILPKMSNVAAWQKQNTSIDLTSSKKDEQFHKEIQTEPMQNMVKKRPFNSVCGKCSKQNEDIFVRRKKRKKLVHSKSQTSAPDHLKTSTILKCSKDSSSQTEVNIATRTCESIASQTEFSRELRERMSPTIPESIFITEYPAASASNQMWSGTQNNLTINMNKCIQTLDDLDIDTRFPMSPSVTQSTQTSPRCQKTSYLSNEKILDSSLNKYFGYDLGNLHDFNPVFSTSSRFSNSPLLTTDSSVRLLNSETQTQADITNCLHLDDGERSDSDVDIGETLYFNIHTQTPKDLEAIPYDQLLTNMETQTSDPFLLSALALCDIETQTSMLRQNESVGLVDTHTQTNCHQNWRLDTHVNDMETQTFVPNLESDWRIGLINSHTQTPGSWSSLLDIFSEY